MKTQTIINLFTVLLFTVCLGKNPDKDIVIIYTNDVHCAVDEGIGYAGLSTYREEVKKHTPYVTLVDVGDAVQGATIGTLSHGKNIIDIMNEVKYDIAVPGNHEFDYGMEQFRYFTKYLNCEYISCNFRVAKTRKLVFNPYKIITYGDVKVAYVGISTPESFIKSDPASFMDSTGQFIFDFDGDATGQKLYTSVQTAVNDARSHGADYVIALGHLGEFVGITSEWSAQSVVEHTSGIDAFIDGHSHEVTPSMMQKNSEGKEIPITQSGSRLEHIGQVTIGKDGSIKTELIDKNKVPSKDEKITTFIENIKSGYQPILDEVLGYANFNLTLMDETETWSLRKEETNLANFVLDAFLSEAKAYGGADIALCNSGYIRSPLSLGKITYSDALSLLPFTSESCIYDIQGQTILDALEMGARNYPVEDAGLLHTAGLTYSIDPSINSTVIVDDKNIFSRVSGQRRVYNVLVKNKPIDPNRTYRVISNTYIMRDKGDGYIFNGKKLVNTNFALPSDLLINYIRKLKVIPDVYRKPQGRLIVSSQRNVKRSFLSPIKMTFEGLTSMPFNENMNVGEVKEFPFKITLDQDIIPEDSYNITLTVQPQSTDPGVAEFVYDEETRTLKLLAKSNGKSQLAIQYSIDISIPSMNEYISLSHGLGIYTINVESNVILQERLFLSPIKMSFEGLSSLPFNENMNVGDIKEFPFNITLDQEIIPEDSYNITLTVQPQSTEPDVAEFIYDEETKTLKLLAKSNGKSQLAIQYAIDISIPSMNEYVSLSHGLGIYTINVESNTILQERLFLSPIKMSFEGLSSLPFNEDMNVGDIKEFPFNITLDQDIIPEDSYNITLTVQPESTDPDVAEFIYDEETKTLKLLAKSNGKSQLAIQYAIDISIPSMNEYISLSHGLGIYTINVESNTILQERSFLSPIKMSFEGLSSLPFNENMNVGDIKEFPFIITLDQEIIPEDSYNITLTVQPESSDPDVAEFIYDEDSKTLKLLSKSVGESQLAIQYTVEISIPSMNEYISLSKGLGIYTITVESNTLQERDNTSGGTSIGYSLKLLAIPLFVVIMLI